MTEKSRGYIFITVVLCIFYLIASFLVFMSKFGFERVKKQINNFLLKRKREKENLKQVNTRFQRLNNLDYYEKAVLREFFLQGSNTIHLPIKNPAVLGLKECGIIEPIKNSGINMICGTVYSWMISTDIEFLITDILLDIPVNPTEEEKKIILNNRPKFRFWCKNVFCVI